MIGSKTSAAILVAIVLGMPFSARAAEFADGRKPSSIGRPGVFAGARLRIAIGGKSRSAIERLSAGLNIASACQQVRTDGTSKSTIGEGVAFGLSPGRRFGLAYPGGPL